MSKINSCKTWIILISVLAIILVLSTRRAHGQPRVYGQDYLAAQHSKFSVRESLPFLQDNSALGSLDNTFGTSITNIDNLLSSGKFNFYRVHLINSSCVANRNCGRYEIGYGYSLVSLDTAIQKKNSKILKFVFDRSRLYCNFITKYPNIKLLISPILEHRLSVQSYRILADTVLLACPNVQLVNNPITGRGERYKGSLIEAHATNVPADIYSWDGTDATDGDIRAWKNKTRKAKIAFVWSRSFNCRTSGGAFVDPRKRDACPSSKTFELTSHITDDQPTTSPTPTFKCNFKPLKSPNIFKVLAEDYPNVKDSRSNLPVAIIPFKPNVAVAVVGVKGHSIAGLTYFGRYQGSLNRYYSGTGTRLSGYEMQKKALNLNGSPWTYLKQGNQCIGPFLGGRRGGLKR